ncbi:hypothetical protein BJ166DRAFT_291752 [Pestalotiopsis sp. NC0098]|nr:hypothetical protein BJ166DRAFT_291752 [Pestalotiopsis sp. NC0098]
MNIAWMLSSPWIEHTWAYLIHLLIGCCQYTATKVFSLSLFIISFWKPQISTFVVVLRLLRDIDICHFLSSTIDYHLDTTYNTPKRNRSPRHRDRTEQAVLFLAPSFFLNSAGPSWPRVFLLVVFLCEGVTTAGCTQTNMEASVAVRSSQPTRSLSRPCTK